MSNLSQCRQRVKCELTIHLADKKVNFNLNALKRCGTLINHHYYQVKVLSIFMIGDL